MHQPAQRHNTASVALTAAYAALTAFWGLFPSLPALETLEVVMPDISPNLALPFIQPAQAQKHVTYNEALQRLDVLVQMVVADHSLTLPPALPDEGACYIAAAGSTNAWAGRDGQIAVFQNGSWQFFPPKPGWLAYTLTLGATLTYNGTAWLAAADQPLRAARLGIATDADDTNRLSVRSAATLLSHAGAGHQIKVNKAGPSDTASLLFQSNWSGRAEMGLAGDDAWSVKVSPDGSAWHQALRIDPAAATIAFSPAGTERMRITDTTAVFNTPVTGTAVQASETDATSGRLLKTGAFGLGAPLVLIGPTPLHTRGLQPGFYTYLASDVPGGPENAAWIHTLTVTQSQADGRRSFLSLRTTGANALRAWFGAQSGENGAIFWTRLLSNELILGAVSQSGGIPTGAIIERGSNANGEYTRFAGGTQICWRSGVNLGSIIAAGAGTFADPYRTDAVVNLTWPAVFSAAPTVSTSLIFSNSAVVPAARQLHLQPTLPPTTSGWNNLRAARLTSDNTAGDAIASVMAIGRWY
jgi:hypothetical protein